jgi:hypothetical protein
MAGLCDFFIAPRDAIVDRNLADDRRKYLPSQRQAYQTKRLDEG